MSKLVKVGNELYYNPKHEEKMKKLINKIGEHVQDFMIGLVMMAIFVIGGWGIVLCVLYFSSF